MSYIQAHSQDYFSRRYDLSEGFEICRKLIAYKGDIYIIADAVGCQGIPKSCIYISKIDLNSPSPIWFGVINDTFSISSGVLDPMVIWDDHLYINTHSNSNLGLPYRIHVIHIDGNYKEYYNYDDIGVEEGPHLAGGILSTDSLLIANCTYQSNKTEHRVEDANLISFDGNIQRSFKMVEDVRDIIRSDQLLFNDSVVLSIYSTWKEPEDIKGYVDNYNINTGERNWKLELPFNSSYNGRAVGLTKNINNEIYGFWTVDSFGIFIAVNPAMIFKINIEGYFEWHNIDWNTQAEISNIFSLDEGGFIICGKGENFHNDTISEPDFTAGYLAKYSFNGEKIWERYIMDYRNGGFDGKFFEGAELQNGDLVLSGPLYYNTESGVSSDLWIVKLDSDGCIEPGCNEYQFLTNTSVVDFYNIESKDIFINPNPFNNEFKININLEKFNQVTYSVYDLNGMLISRGDYTNGEYINLSWAENGVYIFLLEVDGKHLISRIIKNGL